MLEKYVAATTFKCFNRLFNGFCWRNKLSFSQKTHVSQKAVQKSNAKLLKERSVKHLHYATLQVWTRQPCLLF